jgi:hypothetical protein
MRTTNLVFVVPQALLDESRGFFQARGAQGFEGTALWVGRAEGPEIKVVRLFVPDQIARSDEFGACVDLTARAHYTLTDHLVGDERFVVRIHAHPREAYHSARDDENAVLTHEGALSVVVPYYARDPIQLERCAVYRYGRRRGWVQLDIQTIREVFRVVS